MPLLGYCRVKVFVNDNVPLHSPIQHEERWESFRKSFQNKRNLNFSSTHFRKSYRLFLVNAVATLEPKCLIQSKDGKKESNLLSSTAKLVSAAIQTESLSGDPEELDSEELDVREKLRRLRISKANKGNTPWNKGRKHSPETLQRIRERTKLAMQSPKVKMKLANMGHAQSSKTREKISIGVRIGWQKRREMLKLQETCFFDWQNLIAEAARKGYQDEENLQWGSYEILSEQLQQEWLDSIEYRKTKPRPIGSKRAPKSPEQRRKIAEAIAAKWADPEYRSRVCTGLAKYHRIPENAERKVRKRPSGERQSTKNVKKKSDQEGSAAKETKEKIQPKLKKRTPKYKDPLANSKLEMLKNIRAQRVASETKNETLERAKILIAEAQKAAKALEVAAMTSPVAYSSLIEANKLIAEAIQSIKSIENGDLTSEVDSPYLDQNHAVTGGDTLKNGSDCKQLFVVNGTEETLIEDEDRRYLIRANGVGERFSEDTDYKYHKRVNGSGSLYHPEGHIGANPQKPTMLDERQFDFGKPYLDSFMKNSALTGCGDSEDPKPNSRLRLNGVSSVNKVMLQSHEKQSHPSEKPATKRWVRGRLVDVVDGE